MNHPIPSICFKWKQTLTLTDLLIAFGYALARTRNTKTGSAKITIVLATHREGGTQSDREDKASIGDLKKKLKVVMRGMAHLNSFTRLVPSFFTNAAAAANVFTHVDPVPENLVDKVIDERFIVKRAIGNGTWYHNHCKIVITVCWKRQRLSFVQ
ncbi:riboflavin synthase [Fonsecaea monophora]|uniref:Riboflavin synthase n=1 Tax=Fonsecaea monophora TaxID=254056 RepID=A0A177EZ83_9EURO|nr:riboflavin synthase [Fonsecaea monophora]OAG36886.1 riboflavin synthase [Fonsecaea monophora]